MHRTMQDRVDAGIRIPMTASEQVAASRNESKPDDSDAMHAGIGKFSSSGMSSQPSVTPTSSGGGGGSDPVVQLLLEYQRVTVDVGEPVKLFFALWRVDPDATSPAGKAYEAGTNASGAASAAPTHSSSNTTKNPNPDAQSGGRFLTEDYCVVVDPTGDVHPPSLAGQTKTLFCNVSRRDIDEGLVYVVWWSPGLQQASY